MRDVTATVFALSITFAAGCGGSTGASLTNPSDSGTTDTGVSTDAAASGFNPGAIGSLVGSMLPPDAGATVVPGSDAGSDAAVPTPVPPEVMTGCAQLCSKEEAAKCTGFGSVTSCMVGCQLILREPACTPVAKGLFTCANGATASCDSSGNATFASCGAQELLVEGCFLLNAPDTTLMSSCTTYCANVAAAKCPSDNPSGCVESCQILGNLFGCDSSWTDYVTCANSTTLSCGSDGKAGASGACLTQAATFWECAASGLVSLDVDAGG